MLYLLPHLVFRLHRDDATATSGRSDWHRHDGIHHAGGNRLKDLALSAQDNRTGSVRVL